MRTTAPAAGIVLLIMAAVGFDSGVAGLADALLWGIAYANFYLVGCIIGWVLAWLTRGWEPPPFVWKWFDFFAPPGDRREDIGA